MKHLYIILKKEINTFFSSSIGYTVISIFLLINSLFLWIFKGNYNLIDNGFADLSSFFDLSPWIFMFIIPAITMRSFSEEYKSGTIELLMTKPIKYRELVLGKFFGSWILIIISLLPTLLYVYSIWQLGSPTGNIPMGSTLGSYIGLGFLAAVFVAIGILASSSSDNQVVAYLITLMSCLLFYYGFEGLSQLGWKVYFLETFGLKAHFQSIGKGILDTRDFIYFISLTILLLTLTERNIKRGYKSIIQRHRSSRQLFFTIIALVGLHLVSSYIYKRFDLTKDKRYTLSESTLEAISRIFEPMYVDIFLEGELPPEFKKLQEETRQTLREFSAKNNLIQYNFINPLENSKNTSKTMDDLLKMGLVPTNITIREGANVSQRILLPWALVSYAGRSIRVPLLNAQPTAAKQERVASSIAQLEYAFSTAILKTLTPKKKKIAILKGNGELGELYIADFLKGLKESYSIAPFTLDSVTANPQKTLDELKAFDLVVVAKPTQLFVDGEKQVLDQYVMQGGRLLLLIDQVQAELDSLLTNHRYFAMPKRLQLEDLLFKYGVRINPVLVKDLSYTEIVLASGTGSNATYHRVPWLYSPMIISPKNHPINKQVGAVKFQFANSIDTLSNDIRKTILLHSSPHSKLMATPRELHLEYVLQKPDRTTYNQGNKPMAVLLEGRFSSVYKNRIKPLALTDKLSKSSPTKVIVIADGDIIKNELEEGQPLELGFDKWTNQYYANRDFLLNCVNYLLDDAELIAVRTKAIDIPFLDKEKIAKQATFWKVINTLLPLIILSLFFILYQWIRRRKYQNLTQNSA